jgi:hypothetical protein
MTAILALLIPIVWIEHDILIQTHGTIAYPLDDAFLNLTLAKNFAFDHVWGITKYAFTPVSTSLLYPFVLAILYLITGASLIVPLLVNAAAAIWFVTALQRWLTRQQISPRAQLLILIAVIYLTPLPLLVISGMEYTMELLFTFLFLSSFLSTPGSSFNRKVYVYAILMLTSSYETLPILIIACGYLALRRHWWDAVKLLFIPVLPLYLFGLLSLTKHNYFVPIPLLQTWGFPSISANPYYLGFLTGCATAFIGAWIAIRMNAKDAHKSDSFTKGIPPRQTPPIPTLRILTPSKPTPAKPWPNAHTRFALPFALLTLPLILLAASEFRHITGDCINVYAAQYQPARFVTDYYYQDPVASNDLGAISFCAIDDRIIDLKGLSNLEVLERKRMNNWTPASADSLSERMNANVAILHHSWSDAEVEPYWYRIATWQMPNDSVSFYSIDRRFIERLRTNMHAFEPKLPPGVKVHYFEPIEVQ